MSAKMYGVQFKGEPRFHLNSHNVFTEMQLPNSQGDWQVFWSPAKALEAGKKFKPHTGRELEAVELK